MTFDELNKWDGSLGEDTDRASVPDQHITFDELLELASPHMMSETLDGLIDAKIMIDEYHNAHPEQFTPEENTRLHRIRATLMRDIGNLASRLPELPGFPDEEDNGIIPTIVIPAGRPS